MRWVLSVVAGGAAGVVWGGPPWLSLAVAAGAIAVALPPRGRVALFIAAVGCLAAARTGAVRAAHLTPPAWIRTIDGVPAPARATGHLLEDARVEDGSVRLAVALDAVECDGRWQRASGRAEVTVGGAWGPLRATGWTRGRRVTAMVQWRAITVWRDPGAGPEWWQRLRRDAVATGHVKSAALVEVAPGPRWADAQAGVRRAVRQAVADTTGRYAPVSAAVVTAILIGDRSALDDETTRRLQAAGTYHVIAISGGNVAVLVVAVLVLLQPWSRHRRGIVLVTMLAVVAYGSVVVPGASVMRAVVVATLALGLAALGLRAPPLRLWLATAAVVGMADPLRLIDAGTWLSFGATAGILAWAPALYARWRPRRVWMRPLVAACAATVSAEAVIAPLTAAVFGQVSVAGLLLNLVAIPAMAVVELSGLAAVATATWAPTAAGAFGWIAHTGVQALLRSAALVDLAPWLVRTSPPQPLAWTVVYYAALVVLWRWPAMPMRWRRPVAGLAALALVIIVWSPVWPWQRPPAGWLRVTFLDVGQGDAIVVELPSGRALLIDAGGASPGFDVGERVVRPALWALGRRRLDWLVVTHGDGDHAGGVPAMLSAFTPREFWDGVPMAADPRWHERRRRAAALRTSWRQVQAGDRLEDGPVTIDVWHPPRPDWERPVVRNDDSVVLRVAFGDVGLLLTGDAGREVEAGWPSPGGRLRVVQVPHHGSRTSSSPAFVRGAAPHAAVISVGRGNTFGHPAPEVLAAYAAIGAAVFRTDRDGAVTLATDGRQLRIETWTGRRWEAAVTSIGGGVDAK